MEYIAGRGNGKPTQSLETIIDYVVEDSNILNLKMEGVTLKDIAIQYKVGYQRIHQRLEIMEDKASEMIANDIPPKEIAARLGCKPQYIKKYIQDLYVKYK